MRGKLFVAAQLPANLKSVETRKYQVENNQVRTVASHLRERQTSVRGIAHLESFLLKVVLQEFDQVAFILDEQDLFRHGLFIAINA